MPENETTQNEMIDLDFNQEDIDLSRPVLKDGTYDATIKFTRKETSKNGHPLLLVGYNLAQPAETVKGDQINPGFTLTQRIIMQPTGKLTQDMINKRLAAVNLAATGAKTGKPNTGNWIGKPVRVRVKVREARKNEETGDEYPASNEVSDVYGQAQTQTAAA